MVIFYINPWFKFNFLKDNCLFLKSITAVIWGQFLLSRLCPRIFSEFYKQALLKNCIKPVGT